MKIESSIKQALKDNNATLVAHYYVSADIQTLAEETGGIVSDSLEMARFGQNSDADTIVVAGLNLWVKPLKFYLLKKEFLL